MLTAKYRCPLFCAGGAGVHVQPDRRNRSSDDAQSLRSCRLGGQLSAHHLFRIHEVSLYYINRINEQFVVSLFIWYFMYFNIFVHVILVLRSYMTTTFVIEAMAAANAQLRWKRREQDEVRLRSHEHILVQLTFSLLICSVHTTLSRPVVVLFIIFSDCLENSLSDVNMKQTYSTNHRNYTLLKAHLILHKQSWSSNEREIVLNQTDERLISLLCPKTFH